MKKLIASLGLVVAMGFFATPVIAQQSHNHHSHAAHPYCGYSLEHGWSNRPTHRYVSRRATANDPSGIPQVLRAINQSLSIQTDFDVYILENENNAFATVSNGRKVIGADVDFLVELNRIADTEWAAIQVLAHEIGHHIAGFSSNRIQGELNADYWSGQALYRLGASKDAAKAAILTVGTDVDTPSHPNKYSRARTIEEGWEDARNGRINYDYCMNCR